VLNSSSVTTVLVVSFITAGAYALLPIAVGFFMTFTAKTESIKHVGMMVMGLALVFFGMGIMSKAMTPLRSYEPVEKSWCYFFSFKPKPTTLIL